MSRVIRCIAVACAVVVLAPAALAAPAAEHQVFTDGLNDGGPLAPDYTPPWQDLVAGYIEDTPDTIQFTWEVADFSIAPPEGVILYWEFALAPTIDEIVPCTEDASRCYSVRAFPADVPEPGGQLRANCTTTGSLVQCETIEDAVVEVTVDGNQVTATVQRSDLGDPADGAILYEAELFQGIGAFTGYVLVSGAMGDLADLDEGFYVVGDHRV